MSTDNRRNPRPALVLAAAITLLSAQLLLFTPLEVFALASGDSSRGFMNLLQHLGIPVLVGLVLPTGSLLFLPRDKLNAAAVLMLGLAFLVYLQRLLFLWGGGLITKDAAVPGLSGSWHALELLIWGAGLGLALLARTLLLRQALRLLLLLLLLQIYSLADQLFSTDIRWSSAPSTDSADERSRQEHQQLLGLIGASLRIHTPAMMQPEIRSPLLEQ